MRCWSNKSLAHLARRSSLTRSDLVRPNRARLTPACFADCSYAMRFLKRFRLTVFPMPVFITKLMGEKRQFRRGAFR